MTRRFFTDAIGWGVILWLIGYVLGIVLFAFVPYAMIGWIILPMGTIVALWILWKRIHGDSLQYYVWVAVAWVLIAIACDYFFLVKLFKPADGYYKLDVYVYYALTFILPLVVGWRKLAARK